MSKLGLFSLVVLVSSWSHLLMGQDSDIPIGDVIAVERKVEIRLDECMTNLEVKHIGTSDTWAGYCRMNVGKEGDLGTISGAFEQNYNSSYFPSVIIKGDGQYYLLVLSHFRKSSFNDRKWISEWFTKLLVQAFPSRTYSAIVLRKK